MKFTMKVKGLKETEGGVLKLETRVLVACETFMFKTISHITERAQANAPILSGDLRAAMAGYIEGVQVAGKYGLNRQTKYNTKRAIINGKVVDTMSYALRMHEDIYNLGPISRKQPPTREGGVGRKYIQRVVAFHRKRYKNSLQKFISMQLHKKAIVSTIMRFP